MSKSKRQWADASAETFNDFWRTCGDAGPTAKPGAFRRLAWAAWLAGSASGADLAELAAIEAAERSGMAADVRAAVAVVARELDRAALEPGRWDGQ